MPESTSTFDAIMASSIWIDVVGQFLDGEEWKETVKEYVDAHCALFAPIEGDEYDHGHFDVWNEFRNIAEAIIEAKLAEIGGSAESFFKACDERLVADDQGPREAQCKRVLKQLLSYDDFKDFAGMMTARYIELEESGGAGGAGGGGGGATRSGDGRRGQRRNIGSYAKAPAPPPSRRDPGEGKRSEASEFDFPSVPDDGYAPFHTHGINAGECEACAWEQAMARARENQLQSMVQERTRAAHQRMLQAQRDGEGQSQQEQWRHQEQSRQARAETDYERAIRLSLEESKAAEQRPREVSKTKETDLERAIRISQEEEEEVCVDLYRMLSDFIQTHFGSENLLQRKRQKRRETQREDRLQARLRAKEWELQLTLAKSILVAANTPGGLDSEEEQRELVPWAQAVVDMRAIFEGGATVDEATMLKKMQELQKLRLKVDILVARRMTEENRLLREQVKAQRRELEEKVEHGDKRGDVMEEAEADLASLITRTQELADVVAEKRSRCYRFTRAPKGIGTGTDSGETGGGQRAGSIPFDIYQRLYFFLRDVLDDSTGKGGSGGGESAEREMSRVYHFVESSLPPVLRHMGTQLVPEMLQLLVNEIEYAKMQRRVRELAGDNEAMLRRLAQARHRSGSIMPGRGDAAATEAAVATVAAAGGGGGGTQLSDGTGGREVSSDHQDQLFDENAALRKINEELKQRLQALEKQRDEDIRNASDEKELQEIQNTFEQVGY